MQTIARATMPKYAASSRLAIKCFLGGKKLLITVMTKIIRTSMNNIFTVLYKKKLIAEPKSPACGINTLIDSLNRAVVH